jgi:hypothetical protein
MQLALISGGAAPHAPDTPVAQPETQNPERLLRARGSLFGAAQAGYSNDFKVTMPRRAGRSSASSTHRPTPTWCRCGAETNNGRTTMEIGTRGGRRG